MVDPRLRGPIEPAHGQHPHRSGRDQARHFHGREVQEGLRTGRFASTDLAWREGMAELAAFAQMDFGTGRIPLPAGRRFRLPRRNAGRTGHRRGCANRSAVGSPPGTRAFPGLLRNAQTRPPQSHHRILGHRNRGRTERALIYAVIGGSVGFIVYFLFSLFMSSFGLMGSHNELAGVLGVGMGAIVFKSSSCRS